MNATPELSIIIPCLNEADTLEECIHAAKHGLRTGKIDGEIIVADNGSTDKSIAIAERNGARVISVQDRGYGSALMGGIDVAQGRFIMMGDADCSYDFKEIPKFMAELRKHKDLVQGCRLPRGGGTVMPGAMPFLHRWWGNPMFTFMARIMFKAPINDIYCGLRAFSKEHYHQLKQRCTGMEFAVEMIIKSSIMGANIAEVPTTLHPDKRVTHAPHLKTFRDGWRTLRFLLMCSPRWLFAYPGLFLMALGSLIGLGGLLDVEFANVTFGGNALLLGSLTVICGYQAVAFSLASKTYGMEAGLIPTDKKLSRFFELFKLEHGLILSVLAMVTGGALMLWSFLQWAETGYGPRDYSQTLKQLVPGITLVALGFQSFLTSFLISILGVRHR